MLLTRSQIMARVRGRGNESTEKQLARLFRNAGINGWRRHLKLPGTPDFAFTRCRVVVFVDGCFWHSCPRHATIPATRRAFWLKKFADNKARDLRVNRELRRLGWCVVRIWEHGLIRKNETRVLRRIRLALKKNHPQRR